MPDPINTIPLQQFLKQVKAADLSQQREIKMDMQTAKALAFCLAEVNARLLEDYDLLFKRLQQAGSNSASINLNMDGGGFSGT
jgi:hypothetical protein